jgi:hypothetical protein
MSKNSLFKTDRTITNEKQAAKPVILSPLQTSIKTVISKYNKLNNLNRANPIMMQSNQDTLISFYKHKQLDTYVVQCCLINHWHNSINISNIILDVTKLWETIKPLSLTQFCWPKSVFIIGTLSCSQKTMWPMKLIFFVIDNILIIHSNSHSKQYDTNHISYYLRGEFYYTIDEDGNEISVGTLISKWIWWCTWSSYVSGGLGGFSEPGYDVLEVFSMWGIHSLLVRFTIYCKLHIIKLKSMI